MAHQQQSRETKLSEHERIIKQGFIKCAVFAVDPNLKKYFSGQMYLLQT